MSSACRLTKYPRATVAPATTPPIFILTVMLLRDKRSIVYLANYHGHKSREQGIPNLQINLNFLPPTGL